jgi:small-conductance mechanosensitive channel
MTISTKEDHFVSRKATSPHFLSRLIFGVFAWIIVGICFIYGVRFWFNSNVNPSFLPITGAAFSAAIAFTLVLALEYATGAITIKLGPSVEFEGASGPIILWCLCFVIIASGLHLLGLSDVTKAAAPLDPRSVLQLFRGRPPILLNSQACQSLILGSLQQHK